MIVKYSYVHQKFTPVELKIVIESKEDLFIVASCFNQAIANIKACDLLNNNKVVCTKCIEEANKHEDTQRICK